MKRALSLLLLLTLAACSMGAPNLPAIFASPTPIPPTATPLPPTATPIPLAISINGEGLTTDELNAELARYKTSMTALGKTVTDEQALQVIRDDTIFQVLLAQGAAEAGFVLDAAALQQRLDALTTKIGGAAQLTTWEQAHGYTAESFNASLKRAAAAAWMRDKIMSAVPSTSDQVHVRQILLYNEDVAKSYYSQLQAGANFEELAAQVDPITHGDIGMLLDHQTGRELSPDALSTLQAHALNDWLAARRQQSSIVLTP